MTKDARTKRPPPLKLAMAILFLTFIWLALSVFHVFRTSPVRFPAWVGVVVGLGALVTPPIFTFSESLHWIVRLSTVILFMAFLLVFPWFYDQHRVYYSIIMLLLYLETFGIVPWLLKRRKRRAAHVGGD